MARAFGGKSTNATSAASPRRRLGRSSRPPGGSVVTLTARRTRPQIGAFGGRGEGPAVAARGASPAPLPRCASPCPETPPRRAASPRRFLPRAAAARFLHLARARRGRSATRAIHPEGPLGRDGPLDHGAHPSRQLRRTDEFASHATSAQTERPLRRAPRARLRARGSRARAGARRPRSPSTPLRHTFNGWTHRGWTPSATRATPRKTTSRARSAPRTDARPHAPLATTATSRRLPGVQGETRGGRRREKRRPLLEQNAALAFRIVKSYANTRPFDTSERDRSGRVFWRVARRYRYRHAARSPIPLTARDAAVRRRRLGSKPAPRSTDDECELTAHALMSTTRDDRWTIRATRCGGAAPCGRI